MSGLRVLDLLASQLLDHGAPANLRARAYASAYVSEAEIYGHSRTLASAIMGKLCPFPGPTCRPLLSPIVPWRPPPPVCPHPDGPALISCYRAATPVCCPAMSGAALSSAPAMCDFASVISLADKRKAMRTGLITAALTLIPAVAFAHTGAGDAHGFGWGFAHPFGGLDHVLAMVTVGILAWQLGGRALALVPATFILVMAAGAALGMARLPLPLVEIGIAVSVIVLGGMVAFTRKAPIAIAVGLVG